MKGNETRLVEFMDGSKKRFVIPVYQRNYDWRIENCKQLFDDLVKKRFLHPEVLELFTVSGDKNEIIDYIENYSADSVKWDILKGNKRKTD